MSDGRNTHAEAGARVLTEAPLRKLTLTSVFLNGELRNFPFSLVHNHGSSERWRKTSRGGSQKGVKGFSLDRGRGSGLAEQHACQIYSSMLA